MIISEFYDDDRTLTYGDDSCILTANITDLGVTAADIDKAYLMGYVDPDYVPQISHLTRIDVVSGGDADYVEFTDVTDKKNIPWMYTSGANATGSTTGGVGEKGCAYRTENSNGWNFVQASPTLGAHFMQFINSLKISNAGERIVNVNLIAYTIDTADTTKNKFWSGGNSQITFTNTSEFLDWLNGDVTKQVNIQASSSPGFTPTLDITGTDFSEGGYEIDVDYGDETGRFKMFVYVTGMQISTTRGIDSNSALGQYPVVSVTYHHTSTDGVDWLYKVGGLCGLRFAGVTSGDPYYLQFTTAQLYDATYTDTTQGFINDGNRYVFGGFTGRIPYRWLLESAAGEVIKHNRTLIRKYSAYQNSVRIYVFFLTSDMLRIAQQWIRIQLSGTLEYGFSDNVGVPKYKTDNSPNWEILTGDFDTIESDLRPWQIDDIRYNPFTIDDVPPYHGGDDDGDDSGGDDIRPSDWTNLRIGAANNFVTLYGMTAETVSDFGRKMWAQLADPAFWQMVGTAFTNDFSINPADMMRYFVSLRYFPFDVSDFAHTTSSGVYIGRAASPIAPSVGVAYPLRLTNSTVQVSGGTLTIPRRYNDFRDYEPCTTVQVHIPFCGSVEIPASEVMGHTLDLTYKIDLQTGAMMGVLCVQSDTYYVIATVAGTVGASIPITANNNIEFLQRIATIGGGLVGGGVSGALKGAMLGGDVGAVVGAVAGTVGGGVGALAGLPPVTVHKQGNASGFANLGGVPYAYATVQRSRFELPDNYGHTTGYACDFAATVSELSGYTVCDNVDTSGLSCNAQERDEIKRLLESGVYV